MTKNQTFRIVIITVALATALLWAYLMPFFNKLSTSKACINKNCFVVRIADSDFERSRGLMNVAQLDDAEGMLFVFKKTDVYPFWMKNTLIPLDIIWINEDKVVYISHDANPCTQEECPKIDPGTQANYVLELNGGIAERLGIKVQDNAVFSGL